jgi:hypothetical protein
MFLKTDLRCEKIPYPNSCFALDFKGLLYEISLWSKKGRGRFGQENRRIASKYHVVSKHAKRTIALKAQAVHSEQKQLHPGLSARRGSK